MLRASHPVVPAKHRANSEIIQRLFRTRVVSGRNCIALATKDWTVGGNGALVVSFMTPGVARAHLSEGAGLAGAS